MRDKGITYLKGDWTNEDPEITAILEEFNRPSVPLYLYYPSQGEAEILPQILTPGTLVEVFEGG
jgi:thiol:disulfide interchange protein DsbD